jgi:hypothetical protein
MAQGMGGVGPKNAASESRKWLETSVFQEPCQADASQWTSAPTLVEVQAREASEALSC